MKISEAIGIKTLRKSSVKILSIERLAGKGI